MTPSRACSESSCDDASAGCKRAHVTAIVEYTLRACLPLRRLVGLEFLCGDAGRIVPWLTRVGRRFDFVMEDVAYAAPPEVGLPLAEALVALVAPGGRLVINRHLRGDGRAVAAALRPHFREIRVRRVRRDGENVLICCYMGGPEMAPHTPPTLAAPRRSRGTARSPGSQRRP